MVSDLLREKVVRPISTEELSRRWAAVREVMRERKVDYLLIQNSNDYLGGYVKWFTDMPAVHGYPVTVIFPAAEEMTTIWQGPRDQTQARPPEWLFRGVRKRLNTPIMLSLNYTCTFDAQLVVEALGGHVNPCISFLNEDAMTAGFSRYVRQHLPGARFVDITDEVDLIKAVKSDEEIALIRESAQLHDEAMKACLEALRPGVREYEVAAQGRLRCRMLGSEQQFIFLGSAPAGKAFPWNHIHAMNRVLQKGDQVGILIEASGPSGHYTHLHRIACIGIEPPEELQRQWETVKEAQRLTLEMLKPGVDVQEILAANNAFLRSRGYPEESRTYAHGQGYDLVERPSFQPGETLKILAGMNLAVHPKVGTTTANAIIVDNYLVTPTGVSDCLHRTPKEIFRV